MIEDLVGQHAIVIRYDWLILDEMGSRLNIQWKVN